MTIYDLVFEKIQEKYENGEYTIEEAEMLNDLAYDRYVNEGAFKKYRDVQHDKVKALVNKRDQLNKILNSTPENSSRYNTVLNKLASVDDELASLRSKYRDLVGKENGSRENHEVAQAQIKSRAKNIHDYSRFDGIDELQSAKHNFMRKTQGPKKQVINPDNIPGRYAK